MSRGITEELLELKQKIEQKVTERIEAELETKRLYTELKKDHGVITVEEAETLLKKYKRNLQRKDRILTTQLGKLKEGLDI